MSFDEISFYEMSFYEVFKTNDFFVNDGVVQKNNQTMKKRIGSIRQIEELTYFRKQQKKKQTN